MFLEFKKELIRTKTKRRNLKKTGIKQLNINKVSFKFFIYFLHKQKLLFNQKMLRELFISEKRSFLSLQIFLQKFYAKNYQYWDS